MNRDFMEVPDNGIASTIESPEIGKTSLLTNSDLDKASASGAVKTYIVGNQEIE